MTDIKNYKCPECGGKATRKFLWTVRDNGKRYDSYNETCTECGHSRIISKLVKED